MHHNSFGVGSDGFLLVSQLFAGRNSQKLVPAACRVSAKNETRGFSESVPGLVSGDFVFDVTSLHGKTQGAYAFAQRVACLVCVRTQEEEGGREAGREAGETQNSE